MFVSSDEMKRIYFLTHTDLPEHKIHNIATICRDIFEIIDIIHTRYKAIDKNRDWSIFDYEYKNGRLFFAENITYIDEQEIYKDTYTHQCRNKQKYIIQIIGEYGYCRKCDTQFFPRLWSEHQLRSQYTYLELKQHIYTQRRPFTLDQSYHNGLHRLGIDDRILAKAIQYCHSPFEIERMLNTKNFDRHNPPPPSRLHNKLLLLANIWKTRPVNSLALCADTEFFFHTCNNNQRIILFQDKKLYTWCPNCFTKFIPEWDTICINLYTDYFHTQNMNQFTNNPHHTTGINDPVYNEKDRTLLYWLSVLGLPSNAHSDDIQRAFRKLSKLYHPDSGGDKDKFQQIVNARNFLLKHLK